MNMYTLTIELFMYYFQLVVKSFAINDLFEQCMSRDHVIKPPRISYSEMYVCFSDIYKTLKRTINQ